MKHKKKPRHLAKAACFVFFLFSSTGILQAKAADRTLILATLTPYASYAKILLEGVPGVEVKTLIPPGSDPHAFSLTPSTLSLLKRAKLVLGNGKVENLIEISRLRNVNRNAPFVFTFDELFDSTTDKGQVTPHTWLNPESVSLELETIADELTGLFPGEKKKISLNLSNFQEALRKVERKIEEILSGVGKLGVITYHDGLDGFCKRFGITVVGHAQKRHGVPPSPRDLFSVINRGKKFDGRLVVIAETRSGKKTMEKIATILNSPLVTISVLPPQFEKGWEYAWWLVKIVEKITGPIKMRKP